MNTKELLKHHNVYLGAAAATGALLGSAVTFVATRAALKKKYEDRAQEVVESELQAYRRQNKLGEYATPESAAAILLGEDGTIMTTELQGSENLYGNEDAQRRALQELRARLTGDGDLSEYGSAVLDGETDEQQEAEVRVSIEQNVFDTYSNPLPRDPERPYVISVDEFEEGDENIDRWQLTLYADGVLTHENEQMVEDVDAVVGLENLELLGSIEANILSKDESIIYVRNEKMGSDYEIKRDNNEYAVVIAGMRPGYSEESPVRGVQKFRDGRDR